MSAQVQGIKVYCRLRPLKKNDKFVKYEIIKQKQGIDVLDIKYKASRNNLNNKYQYYEIFEENTPQSKVFENVALPVLDKFLSGMNSTIFTYGQTCSGKTHTMYGSQEDPGIILRSFEYLFQRTEELLYDFNMEYIEIYKDEIYDLLENKDNNSSLKKTKNINKNIKLNKKVKFTINQKGDISFKNLSKFKINSFNDAIKILEVGDMRKSVSPTSMNIQSSRAHCICRISYKCKHKEIKLNLVDLAGSERISKSFVNEKTFAESRSINASLHYLNLVINVLENPKMHVPYRNSTITSVLKGSLGTKCATAMIATVVLNRQCIAESLSTCRFSKAVAAIKKIRGISSTQSKMKNKWDLEKEILENENKELKDALSKSEKQLKKFERLSLLQFLSNVIEKKIDDKITNTENNEDLTIKLINNNEELHDELHKELKADGIGMNVACDVHDGQFEPYDLIIGDGIINVPAVDVIIPSVMESGDGTNDDQKDLEVNEEVENLPSDVSDNELGLNFEIVDDNSNVPAVYVKAPVVHYGVETDNNQITRLDTIDNNKIVVLKNSGFYRVADVFHKHCKFIVMLMIITLIFKPQRLLWNNELGTDTENFDSAVFNNLKYIKPVLSMDSILPEWLKFRLGLVKLCPEGSDFQTHCCCGQCLWICTKPNNKRTSENILNDFCDCRPTPRVMDPLNIVNDHQSTKSWTWCNQTFKEYLTLANSVLNKGIYVLGCLFVIILMTMVLFKLFRLRLINISYICNENADSSNSNTQKITQSSSITENIEPENLPTSQVTVKQLQSNGFTEKAGKRPATVNLAGESQTGFKRYGFQRRC